MGRKSRQKRAPERREGSPATAVLTHPTATRSAPRLKHRWLARLVAVLLVPLLLGVVEVSLRLFGYGYPTRFFVLLEDATVTTNPRFAWQYYPKRSATAPTPVVFTKEKAPGTARIFVLGESAAAGTPDPAFGFARMIEVMLRHQYPSNRFEIINAAMRGIDSHIIRTIAAECAKFSPDLFVVYAGNNDMIGLHSPSPGEFRLTSSIHWIRLKEAVARLKLMQLGGALWSRVGRKESPKQDMEFFRRQRLAFDDPRRAPVYEHYERNVRDIVRFAERAGARTLLCTVGVNLRDFPPLASLHRPGLSAEDLRRWEKLYAEGAAAESAGQHEMGLKHFTEAERIDGHFAELLFRIARCQEALGRADGAQRYFVLARDWDAIQFRTDSRLNGIVHSITTNAGPRVTLVDVEQVLARSPIASNGVAGGRIFQEHVHFTFEGDHQVASILLPAITSALGLPAATKPLPTRDDCGRALAYTTIDELNVRAAINRMTANPPFLDQLDHAMTHLRADHALQQRLKAVTERDTQDALAIYAAALTMRPEDWMLHFNFGNLLAQLNRHAASVPHYAEVVKRLPNQHKFRVALGNALLQSGQAAAAREEFQAALRIDPDFKPAQDGLSLANGRR